MTEDSISLFIVYSLMIVAILLITYFEHYYFIIIIKTTMHIIDSLSPIVLGVFQGLAISFLEMQATNQNFEFFWNSEATYTFFGAVLLLISRHYVKLRRNGDIGSIYVLRTLRYSVIFCFLFSLLFLEAANLPVSNWIGLRPSKAREIISMITIIALIAMLLKSVYYLKKWDETPEP